MPTEQALQERSALMLRAIELLQADGPVLRTLADTQGLRIALAQVILSNEDGSPDMMRAFTNTTFINTQIDTVIALVMAAMED